MPFTWGQVHAGNESAAAAQLCGAFLLPGACPWTQLWPSNVLYTPQALCQQFLMAITRNAGLVPSLESWSTTLTATAELPSMLILESS